MTSSETTFNDAELIARLRDAPADGLGTENLCLEAADRIEELIEESGRRLALARSHSVACVEQFEQNEALTEQRDAARQDAKEAEAYAEELENEAVLSKAAYEGVSSLLLSVQQDCIKERQRAERLEAKLAECEARLRKAVEALEEISEYDTGATAGLAYTAKHHLAEITSGVATTPYGLKGENHE